MDGYAMTPLRGRIAIRKHVPLRTGLVWHPDQAPDNERSGQRSSGVRSQSSHRGTVLGMGEPARTAKGDAPIPHGFSVGDEVVFVFALQGTEESRRGTWSDGEPCVWIAQEEVIAVVEQDDLLQQEIAQLRLFEAAAREYFTKDEGREDCGRRAWAAMKELDSIRERMRAVVEHA